YCDTTGNASMLRQVNGRGVQGDKASCTDQRGAKEPAPMLRRLCNFACIRASERGRTIHSGQCQSSHRERNMYEDLCLYIDGKFIKDDGHREKDVLDPATA